MNDHTHEPIIGLDNIIRCRTCGSILPYMTETISKVQSFKRANRVLQEVAVAGKYRAVAFDGPFVVYSRNRDGLSEEITARKINEKLFEIVKKTVSVGE